MSFELLKNELTEYQEKIWLVKPAYMTMDKSAYFERVLSVMLKNEAIINMIGTPAGRRSVILAVRECVRYGVEVGGVNPSAYLVPMKGELKVIISAAGLISLATSEPAVCKKVTVNLVKKGETFSIDYAGQQVTHTWDGETERGDITGGYWIITELDGSSSVGYMGRKEIEHIRDKYAKGGNTWANEFEEMAKKTVVKRALKPYIAKKAGLMMIYQAEQEPTEQEPNERVVTEESINGAVSKAEAVLDIVNVKAEEVQQTQTIQAEPEIYKTTWKYKEEEIDQIKNGLF